MQGETSSVQVKDPIFETKIATEWSVLQNGLPVDKQDPLQ